MNSIFVKFSVIFIIFGNFGFASGQIREASATIFSLDEKFLLGIVNFRQEGPGMNVKVEGIFENLSSSGFFGLEIHQYGEILSNNCSGVGDLWNPLNSSVGNFWNFNSQIGNFGNLGNFGNFNVSADGSARFFFETEAENLPLVGPNSIVGRSLVIYNKTDHLDREGLEDSNSNSNSNSNSDVWAALGCAVIGITTEFSPGNLDLGMTAKISSTDRVAVAVLRGISNGISNETLNVTEYGFVGFVELLGTGLIEVIGYLQNVSPANSSHGFHVHQFGNVNCSAAEGHYNPYGVHHGGRNDFVRHVGDLGNIFVDENGTANINFQIDAKNFPLVGPNSIVGRAVLLHAGEDDMGLGNQSDSLTTGHAGARLGCGVIGIASDFSPSDSPAILTTSFVSTQTSTQISTSTLPSKTSSTGSASKLRLSTITFVIIKLLLVYIHKLRL